MKHGQNNRRQRSRNNGRRYPNQRGNAFESNGPEVKVRGTAQQVLEKYQALARDAFSTGDRVLAEGYLQHAEHYHRILNTENENKAKHESENHNQNRDQNRDQGRGRNNRHQRDGQQNENADQTSATATASENEVDAAVADADVKSDAAEKPAEQAISVSDASDAQEIPIEEAKPARKPRRRAKKEEAAIVADAPVEQPAAGD